MSCLPTRKSSPLRRAYTLTELVVTLPLMTLLLAGMASAIGLASRSMPDGSTANSAALRTAAAMDQFAVELGYATSITSRTATSIVFVTPDRSGNTVAETITYAWSGTAGAPFTRSINASAAETLIPSVQQFAMTYDAEVVGSVQYLQGINVSLMTPLGSARPLLVRIDAYNEPLLP